jgi:hypothetical protein
MTNYVARQADSSTDAFISSIAMIQANNYEPADPGIINIDNVIDNVGVNTGVVPNGGLTDDLTPTLSGYSPAAQGTVLRVYVNTEEAGRVVVDRNGFWQFTLKTPLEPNHEYYLRILLPDPANGETILVSLPYRIVTTDLNQDGVDTQPPEAPTITGAIDGSLIHNGDTTDDNRPTLLGQSESNSTVHVYLLNAQHLMQLIGDAVTDSSGNWTFTVPNAYAFTDQGEYTFIASASDAAGNTSGFGNSFLLNYSFAPETITHYDALQDIPDNNVYYGNGFHITSNTVMGHMDDTSESFSGLSILNYGYNNYYMQMSFDQPTVEVDFRISGLQNSAGGSRVVITSTEGAVLFDHYVTSDGNYAVRGGSYTDFEFTAPSGTEIASVTVYTDHAQSGLAIDNLSFEQVVPSYTASSHTSGEETLITLTAVDQFELTHYASVNLHDGEKQVLSLSENDLFSHAKANQFIFDGKQQLAITGDTFDNVHLDASALHQQWHDVGQILSGGVVYDVYQQSSSNLELLIEHGVTANAVS